MIDSLRRRVFWSILLSAAGVLLAILLAINILRLAQSASKRDSILDSALRMIPSESAQEWGRGGIRAGNRVGKYKSDLMWSVSEGELGVFLLDSDGAVLSRTGCAEQMEEETVSSILAAATADTDGRGRWGDWEYKVVPVDGGVAVSTLNADSLRQENIETALLSLLAFAAACGLFAILARTLSRVIVRPVEENMQMQKRFVADASHELKTPLTVIEANASVLEQTVGQNKWLDYIKEQTGRMSGLVNELLQLSNLEEAGDGVQHRELFDASEAVLTAALPFESVAFERDVTLETDMPETLEARGNQKELEQLAAILIDNAVKHSPAGASVQVSLTESAMRHGRKEVPAMELRVVNSGDTIPPEALPHIFDRFYRVDESRTHKDNSFGLGLAIARGLAEKNDGSITATSQDGVTAFTLLLPLNG